MSKLKNYLSCFGPQFVDGICGLARANNFDSRRFRAKTKPLPNFFELARKYKPQKTDPTTRQLRRALWSAIAIAWMLTATAIAFLNLDWWHAPILILIVVTVPAPWLLLKIAAWCQLKSRKPRRLAQSLR